LADHGDEYICGTMASSLQGCMVVAVVTS